MINTNVTSTARNLAISKGYDFDSDGKIVNADIIQTKMGRLALARKCPIGEGQNASIFLAQNLDNGEFLAVKIYDRSRVKQSYHIDNDKQMKIEQDVLNILGMNKGQHEVYENNQKRLKELYVNMPFIDGVDLEKASKSDIGSFEDALYYAQLATEKLLKLHQNDFIHADLHAGNIMISPKTKNVNLVDFEKCMYMDNKKSHDLEIWGRPSFLPAKLYPNNANNPIMVPVNKDTDRYGLGVALHKMFSTVLGNDALIIDANGNIKLNKIPEGMSKEALHDLVNILHMLTQPGEFYLADIAKAFKSLKEKMAIEPQLTKTYLPSLPSFREPIQAKSENINNKIDQIIGTQAIGASYQFDKNEDRVVEQAKRTLEMGSNMFKYNVDENNIEQLNKLCAMPFSKYFMWWRSGSKKCNLTESDKKAEYDATYKFAKELLLKHAKEEKTFYLGHWEGDWYLLPEYDASKDPSPEKIQGMVDWLNVRQQAVDDARRDVGDKSLSKVYHYTEVNRVRDAIEKSRPRLVNAVLPKTNVDHVSYSSYDVQNRSQETINSTLKYIEDKLPKKDGINGPRVFIGECGVPARDVNFDPVKHEEKNREIMTKFLKAGVPYILYWQMYNNEVKDGKQVGFWLIDDKNQKQPLYHTLEGLYKAQKNFKNTREESISLLENTQCKNEKFKSAKY